MTEKNSGEAQTLVWQRVDAWPEPAVMHMGWRADWWHVATVASIDGIDWSWSIYDRRGYIRSHGKAKTADDAKSAASAALQGQETVT